MGDIQKLTDEILSDARNKAAEIVAEAAAQAEVIKTNGERDAAAYKNRALNRASNDAKLIAERIQSTANLKIRDEKLSAKGEVIDRVMEMVRTKIKHLPLEDELNYIVKILNEHSLKSDEKVVVRPGLSARVLEKFPNARIEEKEGTYGFIIDRNGILENHSYDTHLNFLKDDLEAQISQILFPN